MLEIKGYEYEKAILNIKAKSVRYKRGSYEAYISNNGASLFLGCFATEEEAKDIAIQYRLNRFVNSVKEHGLSPCDGKIYKEKYIVFPEGFIFNLHGKLMFGAIDRCGYRNIIVNGKTERVHRIIAKCFIENPDNKRCVNHIDGDKLNNSSKNLEWATNSENTIHSYSNGLEKKVLGEEHRAHKLTNEAVLFIRQNYKKGNKGDNSSGRLAEKYGVDASTIRSVANKETWGHVK